MHITDNIKMAFSALLANKLRSSLTMLGIAIGNASVIALVGIGQGAQKLASEQFESLGPNTIFISLARGVRRTLGDSIPPLLMSDAEMIAKQVPSVKAVSPELFSSQAVSYQGDVLNNMIIGATPDYLVVRNFQVAKGRFINEIDLQRNNRVVVLGQEIAKRIFKDTNPINQQIRIRNVSFQVVGVLVGKGVLFGANQDDNIILPLTTLESQILGKTSPFGSEINTISVIVKNQESISAAQFQIKNLLILKRPQLPEEAFRIFAQQSIIETANKTNEGLTQMLTAIASVSLLVGGIGVMNIMLVSVSERTQEIGLRKALGAQEKDILTQFLVEAVLLATLGGAVGITFGVGGILIATWTSTIYTTISPTAIAMGMIISSSIGLFFGVVPAQRAAKLDPIVALRTM